MKFINVVFLGTTICSRTQAAHLRGINDNVTGPFDILKCMLAGRTNEEKCHESVDVDGEQCDFCTLYQDGKEAGLCVSSEVAENMQQINPDVKCDGSKSSGNQAASVDLSSNLPSLRCTISAFTDKKKCGQVDDEDCQFCEIDGEEVGLCVNEDVASFSFLNDAISCEPVDVDSDVDADVDADVDPVADLDADVDEGFGIVTPFDQLKCTLEARGDEEKCHESVDADGEPCDYCTISSNGQEAGLCVSSDLAGRMEQVNPAVKCDGSKSSGNEVESVDLSSNLPSLRCTISAFTDKEKCGQVDDEDCQYCQLEMNGQEVGLCFNEDVASELSFFSDAISCESPSDDVDEDTDEDEDEDVDAEGYVGFITPLNQLKCTLEARGDEEKCHESVDADGEPCDYCTISSNGQEAGLCVSSDLAGRMEQVNPAVKCDGSKSSGNEVESVDLSSNLPSLRCTISAFTDKEKCGQVDDEDCQYCQLDMNGQEVSLCLNENVASELSFFNDAISCEDPSDDVDADADDADADADVTVNGPFDQLKCTIEARADETKCHESVDADGEPCDYCTVSSNGQEAGICVSSDLAEKMEQINPDQITCNTGVSLHHNDAFIESFSTCLKVGLTGGNAENCRETIDNTNGEHCIFCQSPVDSIGLCMPSDFRGKTGRYYQCDTGSDGVDIAIE